MQGIKTEPHRAHKKIRGVFIMTKMLLRNRPIEQRNGHASHFECLIEACTSFLVAIEFLVLYAHVEISFRVLRLFANFFQSESQVEPLFCAYPLVTSNLSIVMNDGRKSGKLKSGWQPCGIDDFVNRSMK